MFGHLCVDIKSKAIKGRCCSTPLDAVHALVYIGRCDLVKSDSHTYINSGCRFQNSSTNNLILTVYFSWRAVYVGVHNYCYGNMHAHNIEQEDIRNFRMWFANTTSCNYAGCLDHDILHYTFTSFRTLIPQMLAHPPV